MMFDVLRYMAKLPPKDHVKDTYEYEDKKTSFMDLLKPPMTLAQGAAIMNEYRRSNGDIHDED